MRLHRRILPWLFALAYLFNGINIFGQSGNFNFTHLDINNGLSHNQVNCIFKDSRGFMWFGTMSGLNRFDGYTFKIYRHDPDDSSSINDNYINAIAEDHLGRLWINTRTALSIYDPATESFSDDIGTYLAGLGLSAGNVSDLYRDNRGMIWLTLTNAGMLGFDPVSRSVKKLNHEPVDSGSIVSNDISSFIQDRHGDYWLITHNGILQRIDGNTLKLDNME